MAFDRFIVTHIDPAMRCGYVRQLDASGAPLINEPIRFDLTGMAEITLQSPVEGGRVEIGYSIPTYAVRQRQTTLGTALVGSVARVAENRLARDDDGYLFLRNWGFADQFDAIWQTARA